MSAIFYFFLMIGYLKGVVLTVLPKTLILDINGVGYELFVSELNLANCVVGSTLELYVHTHVREDALLLFGFRSLAERKLFELLLTVNGVGPKSGLEIMNVPTSDLANAIFQEDIAFLTRIPGIGKKTAERILLDLRGKLDASLIGESTVTTTPGKKPFLDAHFEVQWKDIIEALLQLGYDRKAIIPTLKSMNGGEGPMMEDSEEVILKYCLLHI